MLLYCHWQRHRRQALYAAVKERGDVGMCEGCRKFLKMGISVFVRHRQLTRISTFTLSPFERILHPSSSRLSLYSTTYSLRLVAGVDASDHFSTPRFSHKRDDTHIVTIRPHVLHLLVNPASSSFHKNDHSPRPREGPKHLLSDIFYTVSLRVHRVSCVGEWCRWRRG